MLFPGFLVQVGGGFFLQQDNLAQRVFAAARASSCRAAGLGPMFYFDVAGDFVQATTPVASVGRPPTDAYVAFAPLLTDLFIVQAGQFDAPFSLENRTLDPYLPFIERSLAVRTLAVPYHKDLGVMVHGTDDARMIYYSGGIFNGDGPGLRNGDNRVDVIGRVSVSPLARTAVDSLHEASLGASAWYGQHAAGQAFPTQTTPGGFVFFNPAWMTGQMNLDLLESGPTLTLGAELNLPIGHQFGLRGEGIFKQQGTSRRGGMSCPGRHAAGYQRAKLNAIGGYGEAWFWLLGDDRQLPRPGFELPTRLGHLVEPTAQHGVMVTARGEFLQEDLTSAQTVNADPNLATTRLVTTTLAVNYWYGRRVRASLDYGVTFFSGTSENIIATKATNGTSEQELMLLLAMAL